jgi:tRNA U54 and U55 pseudouridine synthase Pus10
VSGDEGRTLPNVSDLLGNPAKTLKLDVLNVIME